MPLPSAKAITAFFIDLNLSLPTQLPTSFGCRMRFITSAIKVTVVFTSAVEYLPENVF